MAGKPLRTKREIEHPSRRNNYLDMVSLDCSAQGCK